MPLKTDGRGGWLPRGARGLLGGLPWKGLRRVWSILRVLKAAFNALEDGLRAGKRQP